MTRIMTKIEPYGFPDNSLFFYTSFFVEAQPKLKLYEKQFLFEVEVFLKFGTTG